MLESPLDDKSPPVFVMQRRIAELSVKRMLRAHFLEGFLDGYLDIFGFYEQTVAFRQLRLRDGTWKKCTEYENDWVWRGSERARGAARPHILDVDGRFGSVQGAESLSIIINPQESVCELVHQRSSSSAHVEEDSSDHDGSSEMVWYEREEDSK